MTLLTNSEKVALRVAVADQLHTARRMLDLAGDLGHVPQTGHPWFAALAQRVVAGLADRSTDLCPCIGRRGPEPMFALVLPGRIQIQCRMCFMRRDRLGPVDDSTCDHCSVYSRSGLITGVLPVGPLLLLFGVCGGCAVDLGVSPDAAAGATR